MGKNFFYTSYINYIVIILNNDHTYIGRIDNEYDLGI